MVVKFSIYFNRHVFVMIIFFGITHLFMYLRKSFKPVLGVRMQLCKLQCCHMNSLDKTETQNFVVTRLSTLGFI